MASARGLVSIRLPRSRWQIFQIGLRRDGLTLQAWMERTIQTATNAKMPEDGGGIPRGGRPVSGVARGRAGPRFTKQIIVRVDAGSLTRLRARVGTDRGSVARWVARAIDDYVTAQGVDPMLVLPPYLLRTLQTALPKAPRVRTDVVCALLDWAPAVIDAALNDAALKLRHAVRAGRVDLIHGILEVAAKTAELRERQERLRATRTLRGGKQTAASGVRLLGAGQAGFDGAGGVALTPLEVAVLANQMRSGNPSPKDDERTHWPAGGIVPLRAPIIDARGAIQPVISVDVRSCELMTSRAGAVRGNHYHRVDWHFCYVLSGSMEYFHRPAGSPGEPERLVVTAGQLVFTPPMVEHAMVFPEDTSILMLRRILRERRDAVMVDLVTRPSRA